jgi:hypothetical protein
MIDEIFECLSDEAMSLRISEKFFAAVEKSLLRESKPAFDVTNVKEHLKKVNPRSNSSEEIRQSSTDALRKEFSRWREHLTEVDTGIETFHIRRFCDSARGTLNDQIFQSLARFYRSTLPASNNQSKFDLMMTRAFAREMRWRHSLSNFDNEKVAEQIRELYSRWNECTAGLDAREEDVDDAIIRFGAFIAEAHSLLEFEGLIESDIFERLREFKRDLGELFYAPECVAAAIECNVTVGRTFDSLMTVLNTNLHQRIGEKIDFAGALIDGSLVDQSSLVDLLAGMSGAGASSIPIDGNSDIAMLRSFLRRATVANALKVGDRAREDSSENHIEQSEEVQPANSIKNRLAEPLSTISQPEPDMAVLRDYMSTSETLNKLDLSDFLFDADGEPDVLGRRALASIICLEEFKTNDLKNNKTLEPEITDEIVAILNFAERVGDELASAVAGAGQDVQNRILIVSNNLLSSRLQVERAVIRFTTPVEETVPEPVVEEKKEEVFEITRAPLLESNRWLMAITTIVVVVCGSILLFSGGNSSSAAPLAEDMESINVGRLPSSENFERAFRKQNTLFVTAKKSWASVEEAQKRQTLKEMVEVELKKPIYNAVIIGHDGTPAGDISFAGTFVPTDEASK